MAEQLAERQKVLNMLTRSLQSRKSDAALTESTRNAEHVKLQLAWEEASAARCAQDIELALWLQAATGQQHQHPEQCELSVAWRKYRSKVRFLVTALGNPSNEKMKNDILDGLVSGQELVNWQSDRFLSSERLEEKRKILEESLQAVCLQERFEFSDSRLICPRCAASGAKYAVLKENWAHSGQWMSHTRKNLGRHILAECSECRKQWQETGF
eukprot:TRINITY_DN65068_c0_g1_i1.p1 TRINITY_DN65068_c0_g1~~TRINITY_DN65068_c0_g1_i1.p1  ORF type:complete len:234 (+),score=37.11 TRINITY_DN65068_c0_g1_i1:64-702(+)